MKLVICYSTGNYDSYKNQNICIEYESKEKFLEKFIESVDKYFNYKEKQRELILNIFDPRKTKNTKDNVEFVKFVEFFDEYSIFLL